MEAIDTLAFAKKLKSVGLPEAQAEAFAEAQAGMFREMLDSKLATKDDLAKLATKDELAKLATKEELAHFATKEDLAHLATREELAHLRSDVFRAMLGQTITLIGVIFAAAAFF